MKRGGELTAPKVKLERILQSKFDDALPKFVGPSDAITKPRTATALTCVTGPWEKRNVKQRHRER